MFSYEGEGVQRKTKGAVIILRGGGVAKIWVQARGERLNFSEQVLRGD